jgi:hypothetical protein
MRRPPRRWRGGTNQPRWGIARIPPSSHTSFSSSRPTRATSPRSIQCGSGDELRQLHGSKAMFGKHPSGGQLCGLRTTWSCGVRKLGRRSKPSDLQRDRIYPPHRLAVGSAGAASPRLGSSSLYKEAWDRIAHPASACSDRDRHRSGLLQVPAQGLSALSGPRGRHRLPTKSAVGLCTQYLGTVASSLRLLDSQLRGAPSCHAQLEADQVGIGHR